MPRELTPEEKKDLAARQLAAAMVKHQKRKDLKEKAKEAGIMLFLVIAGSIQF